MQDRIAIVGVGAIGGTLAADLGDLARHEVMLCSRTHFDHLSVRHPSGTSEVATAAITDPGSCEPVPWILLATKAHQSEAARPWLDALCRPGSTVAVLQNGVDHEERIAPLVREGVTVLPVVIQLPAEKTAPGRIEQSRDGLLFVPDSPAGRAFAALFEGARTRVRPTDEFAVQAWWKLLSNAALGGVGALTLRDLGVARDDEVRALILTLMREIVAVAHAEGVMLPEDAPEKALERVLGAASSHASSITVDRREGRPMEWEARNAVVGRIARRHGIATPWNDALTALLRAADRGDAD